MSKKVQVGSEGTDSSKSKIIKLNLKDESVHSRKGVEELGLQPEVTEDIHKMLKESAESGKPITPAHDTHKESVVTKDTGRRKGFFYAIMFDKETKKYKGFAQRDVTELVSGKKLNITTQTDFRDTMNECGKEIQGRIDLTYAGYNLSEKFAV